MSALQREQSLVKKVKSLNRMMIARYLLLFNVVTLLTI